MKDDDLDKYFMGLPEEELATSVSEEKEIVPAVEQEDEIDKYFMGMPEEDRKASCRERV